MNLQQKIIIQNLDYNIDTNTITWLELSKIFLENDEKKQVEIILNFLKKLKLPETEESIEEIFKFFSWIPNKKTDIKDNSNFKELSFCFIRDFQYIYAAFFEQYKIDLIDDYLHFHKFKMLFSSLKDDCLFKKIVHWRTVDISGMGEEQKNFYKEQKRIFALEGKSKSKFKNVYEKNDAYFEAINRRAKEVKKWQMEQLKF